MPAAMMHGGGGVLLMMTTKFTSQQTNKQETHELQNKCNQSTLSLTTISTPNNTTQITSKNNNGNQHTPPSNKLTEEMQYFQMRKMDQR